MNKQPWWIAAGALALMAVVGLVLRPASGIKVETATASRTTLVVTVDEEGRTRVRDRYVVASPVDGRLERIGVLEGHRLVAGDLVARIFPTPADPRAAGMARGALSAAQSRRGDVVARMQAAQALKEQTARELRRAQELFKGGAASEEAVEQARLADTTADREIESRKAALGAAEAEVASARAALIGAGPAGSGPAVEVRAPTAGRVLRVLQQSARVVMAGTPLIEIGNASGLEAVIDVLSEEAARISPSDKVTIDQWGGDEVLHGTVRLVEPEGFTKVSALGVEEQRVNVIVDLADPPAALGAGYRVEAHIATWTGENALTVPMSALFQEKGAWTVFTVQDGRAVRRTLRIGHQSAELAEVLGGLEEGDRVIVYPSPLIADGVRVN